MLKVVPGEEKNLAVFSFVLLGSGGPRWVSVVFALAGSLRKC